MRVLINNLQWGNRSGTGRYCEALTDALTRIDPGLEIAGVFPRHHVNSLPLAQCHFAPSGAVSRILYEHAWLPFALNAELLHYPANFGPLAATRPFVVTVHDLSFFRNPGWFSSVRGHYYRALARRTIPHAHRIIADSAHTRDDCCAFLGIAAERIDVVPLGVGPRFAPADDAAHEAVRARYGLPRQFFLYAGTQEPRKNLPRIIAAWSSIAKDTPWDLVIAGRIGWKTGPIGAAAAACGFPGRVHFPGYIEDAHLPALLGAAQAFVWPSLCEGFGLPPLEAMACGTPVITSSTSSLPEVVGDAAETVTPEDTEALARAMRALSQDPARCAQLAAAGRARAARFTWERTAQGTVQSYRRVLGD
ncbi:MAG: glycosyltransferase family 4 protein [Candidatus Hydrogenedentes bacterium]|nr:glycosyltransferase family 4 protein [Candidatus Hydrogenedentota bacterium]